MPELEPVYLVCEPLHLLLKLLNLYILLLDLFGAGTTVGVATEEVSDVVDLK